MIIINDYFFDCLWLFVIIYDCLWLFEIICDYW